MVALDLVFEVAAVVLIAVVGYWIWDRRRYRGSARGAAGLERTGEVFVDPATGRRVRVWFDPRSGRREYREEDGA
ncbi:MAG TPA: hypothetical protein VNM16_07700 [Bacillota bacterium]|nr:hypothetical protein [Bacillota bacterium]